MRDKSKFKVYLEGKKDDSVGSDKGKVKCPCEILDQINLPRQTLLNFIKYATPVGMHLSWTTSFGFGNEQ
jgi:hypothetical protein